MKKQAEFIINRLRKHGYDAYFSGGAVRDLFMEITPYDFDVVTNARAEQIQEIFSDQKFKNVGKAFQVCIVNNIEVASYRKDRYYGLSDKNCEIELANTVEEDLERRDLTINSMAFCPYNSKLIDPFNGLKDIRNKTIRLTGNPQDRIYEDPNRIIRACRFLSKIDGDFSFNTYNALRNNSHLVNYISPERIRLEILKAMKGKQASLFFAGLESIGALEHILPELHQCVFHEGGKYHSENIFEHCMEVGDSITPKFPLIKLTGYLHDIGKPFAYDPEGRTFYSHDEVGYSLLEERLKKLTFTNFETEFISGLTQLHMHNVKDINKKTFRKLLSKLEEKNISLNSFLRLKIADRKGSIDKNPYSIEFFKDILRLRNKIYEETYAFKIKDLNISGNDLINELEINEGPKIGEILRYLFDCVIEDPTLNNYNNLIELANAYYLGVNQNV